MGRGKDDGVSKKILVTNTYDKLYPLYNNGNKKSKKKWMLGQMAQHPFFLPCAA
jgi:hypothetical protein